MGSQLSFRHPEDHELWLMVARMGWRDAELRGDPSGRDFAIFFPLRTRWWYGVNDPVAAIFDARDGEVSVRRFFSWEEARRAWGARDAAGDGDAVAPL